MEEVIKVLVHKLVHVRACVRVCVCVPIVHVKVHTLVLYKQHAVIKACCPQQVFALA
jgi:hypothetical protein